MTCEEAEPLLELAHDGELDARSTLELERHVAGCATCAARRDALESLRRAARAHLERFEVPAALERKVLAPARAQRRRRALAWATPALAVAAALAVAVAWPRPDALLGEVMTAHLRSLQEGHAMDVVSTDQHTVKPWFTGKVPFSVPARDFAAEGFALAGGRLELLDGRPAAALVYRRRAHVLNLFVLDAPGEAPAPPERARARGYTCWRWSQGGLRYWLVGDVAEDELELFARRLAASGG